MESDLGQRARCTRPPAAPGRRAGPRTLLQQSAGSRRQIAALLGMAIALCLGTAQARLYRWVDDAGAVHYTDRMPPSEAEKGHTELNDQGLRVETVPPAQSVEEIERERALERLRAEQERLVEQQKAADRVLLRTFRSVDDLIMARDGKVAAIDVIIGVARTKIRRQQERMQELQADAANLERAGKPVPKAIADGIAKIEATIRDTNASIVEREQQKDKIRLDFDRQLKRFRQLKDSPADNTSPEQEEPRPELRNVVTCEGQEQCARFWVRAVGYVKAHATTPVQTLGSNILLTAPPVTPDDLSLTLSLIREKDSESASLFLDMRCQSEGQVETGCEGDQALSVLDGFRNAVSDPPQAAPLRPVADPP